MLQHRDATEIEVIHEPRRCDSAPCPATGGDSISSSPQGVPKVVYVSAQSEQPALVNLALVLGIFLERVPLDLRAELQRHAEDVERGAYDQGGLGEVFAVGGGGSLRADEEQRVERVEDRVERADHEAELRRHLLLHDSCAVDVLLEHAAHGHAEDDGSVRAQAEQAVERRVGDERWALGQHFASEAFDRIAAKAFREDAIL